MLTLLSCWEACLVRRACPHHLFSQASAIHPGTFCCVSNCKIKPRNLTGWYSYSIATSLRYKLAMLTSLQLFSSEKARSQHGETFMQRFEDPFHRQNKHRKHRVILIGRVGQQKISPQCSSHTRLSRAHRWMLLFKLAATPHSNAPFTQVSKVSRLQQ